MIWLPLSMSLRSTPEAFRANVTEVCPEFVDRVHELKTMDDVKFLDVRLNLLHQWHIDGLLCIGDAAHAMSPVGGVGINLAVQDAVAAATLLAQPLRRGRPTLADLEKIRSRRLLPTMLVQGLQRLLHQNRDTPGDGGQARLVGPGRWCSPRGCSCSVHRPA